MLVPKFEAQIKVYIQFLCLKPVKQPIYKHSFLRLTKFYH